MIVCVQCVRTCECMYVYVCMYAYMYVFMFVYNDLLLTSQCLYGLKANDLGKAEIYFGPT